MVSPFSSTPLSFKWPCSDIRGKKGRHWIDSVADMGFSSSLTIPYGMSQRDTIISVEGKAGGTEILQTLQSWCFQSPQ